MPAEWAPQARTWMAWPSQQAVWREHLDSARRVCAEIAKAIAEFQPVTVVARPELTADASLYCGAGVSVLPLPHDGSLTRDTAPSFVIGDQGILAAIDWQYDGYGGQMEVIEDDYRLAEAICRHLEIERFVAPMIFEGGAFHVDGDGTCLVCAPSVLNPKRNLGLDRQGVEAILADHLGIERVIWLETGLLDDQKGGHVSNVACFAAPGTVLALGPGKDDANLANLEANITRLKESTDAQGRKLEVIEVPCPEPGIGADGRRVARSYVNFAIVNDAVIMPIFGSSTDRAAYRAISAAFADREIIRIEAQDLVQGGAAIHCMTQQQPKSG